MAKRPGRRRIKVIPRQPHRKIRCAGCHQWFQPRISSTKTCSVTCRQRVHRKKVLAELAAAKLERERIDTEIELADPAIAGT
jgi:hypothetical protein